MQDRHSNPQRYFNEQIYTTEKYVIPFVRQTMEVDANTTVLEIGCGEGGNLMPFLNMGCKVVGVDLSEAKIKAGLAVFEKHENRSNIELITADIYTTDTLGKFDLIILRDVIEHIHNQDRFMGYLKKFLTRNGKIFFGFPPWQNPFGGHQQVCQRKLLSVTPYFHLLPRPIYAFVLRTIGGEPPKRLEAILEIKDTGISIERFERIVKKHEYKIDRRTWFLFNPNYEIKFKLKPRKQFALFAAIPFFRNFVTTACYYVISFKK